MRKPQKNRIFELDFLRGLALILMCLDHLAFDFYCLPYWFPLSESPVIAALGQFGEAVSFSPWRLVLHYIFATLFLLLAGVGSALSRRPFRRCLQIAGAAAGITLATVLLDLFFDLDVTILFGALSAMAVGVFLCWLCSLLGERFGKYVALILGAVFIFLGFWLKWYQAPVAYYGLGKGDVWRVVFGTLQYGADWFPVFPCSGVVLVGYFLGKVLYRTKRSLIPVLRGKDCFVCALGRCSLWIYLFHQPVLMGFLYLFVFLFARN